MEQLNRIEIRGTVGNVRVSFLEDNLQVIHFSVVTKYAYQSRSGDIIEATWHNVVAWPGKSIPDFARITKGCTVYVQGRLHSDRYTSQDGQEKQFMEIIAREIRIEEGPASIQL